MGINFGLARMAMEVNGYHTIEYDPGTWKRMLGLPADKEQVRQIVLGWYPKHADLFKLKKDHGVLKR